MHFSVLANVQNKLGERNDHKLELLRLYQNEGPSRCSSLLHHVLVGVGSEVQLGVLVTLSLSRFLKKGPDCQQ